MDIAPAEPVASAPDDAWHLDRRVPIALIGAILLQTFLLGVAWQNIVSTLAEHERHFARTDARVEAVEMSDRQQAATFATIAERLARIDERLTILVEQHRGERSRPPGREAP